MALPILVGVLVGILTRWLLLRIDYRQYPGYPHGYVTHLSLGLVAAFLGAAAIPATLTGQYTAVSFLALAAQQFRDIRNMERKSLEQLEETELVRRGPDYIEGIARVFESRNYLVILTALLTSGAIIFRGLTFGLGIALLWIIVSHYYMSGKRLGDIALVRPGRVHFARTLLYVDEVMIMEVGLKESREKLLKEGVGIILEPKDDNGRATLAQPGQRQAIVHDVAAIVGLKKDFGYPEFTPLIRLDIDTGRAAMILLPIEPDPEAVMEAIRRVPVLESAIRLPLKTLAGRKAAD
ncbi:MAG: YIEGIA family protein [Firmicutes bacterium]|nr:YIEGIA family protein [Bacillota bacterium]MCL5040579.1 YIEGIA family protein [Bacillota bacterium]